jgi:hypothetical protein
VTFRTVLCILLFIPSTPGHAVPCSTAVAFLASVSGPNGEVPRSEVMEQLSMLYQEALNDRVSMDIALAVMREFAAHEGTSVEAIREELEWKAGSSSERKAAEEQRRERIVQERSHLYEGLRPYLDRIGKEHRKEIEAALITPGLITPLSTGEVEFYFKSEHRFVIGAEDLRRERVNTMQTVSFRPGDDFAIGQVPVTQFLYFLAALGEAGVDPTPSRPSEREGSVVLRLGNEKYAFNPNHPVDCVSWDDARAHARRVSGLGGMEYRLPTETEWEFSNRAGSADTYHFGDDSNLLPLYGWFWMNSDDKPQAVGRLLPNRFGIYDTHGNVSEWTLSVVRGSRIVRGGSYQDGAQALRSSHRVAEVPGSSGDNLGFRLLRPSPVKPRSSLSVSFEDGKTELSPALRIHTGLK